MVLYFIVIHILVYVLNNGNILFNIIRLICVAFGIGGLVVRLILRVVPDPKINFTTKKTIPTHEVPIINTNNGY